MTIHYTKNTLEVTAWCPQCHRDTQHRVDEGRQGPCIDADHKVQELTRKQESAAKKREHDSQNPRLF